MRRTRRTTHFVHFVCAAPPPRHPSSHDRGGKGGREPPSAPFRSPRCSGARARAPRSRISWLHDRVKIPLSPAGDVHCWKNVEARVFTLLPSPVERSHRSREKVRGMYMCPYDIFADRSLVSLLYVDAITASVNFNRRNGAHSSPISNYILRTCLSWRGTVRHGSRPRVVRRGATRYDAQRMIREKKRSLLRSLPRMYLNDRYHSSIAFNFFYHVRD